MADTKNPKKRATKKSLPSVEGVASIGEAQKILMSEVSGVDEKKQKRQVRKAGEGEKTSEEKVEHRVAMESRIESAQAAETSIPASSGHAALEAHVPAKDRYFEAVGRRKTAIARVRLFTKSGDFVVNENPYNQYFPMPALQHIVEDALKKMKLFGRFRVSVKIRGGGLHAQAEALRHGLARCLTKFNPDFRKRLKRAGFLIRDPRAKERKKFGLKKARRAPQWKKR